MGATARTIGIVGRKGAKLTCVTVMTDAAVKSLE
jgi:hypothetical protein